MQTTNTFSVLFLVNPKKANSSSVTIYARITVNGKRATISLKRKIPLNSWNFDKKRVRGNSAESKRTNAYLDEVYSNLFQCYQNLRFQGKKVTAQLIKAVFLGEDENSKTLQDLIKYHSRKIESTLAAGTIRNFSITEVYILKFIEKERHTQDIYLKELDYKFLCDFENFLLEYYPKRHPRAMSHNTVMKHIQRLRKMVTMAYHLEWLEKDPFRRWKTTFEKKEREFLSASELSNLETYEFPVDRLDRVRDLFVFSCYTGISYVDIMNLSTNNILMGIDGNNWIVTKRKKTKTPIKIPLLDPALDLITKYRDNPITEVNSSLMPVLTNEKLNVYLKEVAILCGIKKNLTFHMARHTFATTVTLSNGVPIETVSKLLGHTKIATTQIYARVLEKKVSEDMESLRKVLDLKKRNSG